MAVSSSLQRLMRASMASRRVVRDDISRLLLVDGRAKDRHPMHGGCADVQLARLLAPCGVRCTLRPRRELMYALMKWGSARSVFARYLIK